MPGFNGTGPQGAGPMTGGGRGYCNRSGGDTGFNYPGNSGYGRGGRGRRFGRPYDGYPYRPAGFQPYYRGALDEISALKGEAQDLKGALENVTRRIEVLEKKTKQD